MAQGRSVVPRLYWKASLAGAAVVVTILVLIALSPAALAQSQQPYAGLEGRSIKALSEQQVADLRAGRGMVLALAAELNGYPGPMHVLELADSRIYPASSARKCRSCSQP
jgi:hypothetical protein